MSEVNYAALKTSFDWLEEQYVRWNTKQGEIPDEYKDAVKDSLILRFCFCYDSLLSHIQMTLTNYGLVEEVTSSPKHAYRMAHKAHLIDMETLGRLFDYANKRVHLTYDPDPKQVEDTLAVMADFIEDTLQIYKTLSN